MKRSLNYLILLISFNAISQVTNHKVDPKGEFAEINLIKTNKIIEELSKNDSSAIAEILLNPGSYAPPALYILSDVLFKNGEKDKASFWFYAAQLRNRSDINKCNDVSASSAAAVLNQNFGPQINNYTIAEKSDIKFIEETVNKVVEWDAKTPRNYDQRWIALHGMSAFTDSLLKFEPEDNWKSINKKTRDEYRKEFIEALPSIEEQIKKQKR